MVAKTAVPQSLGIQQRHGNQVRTDTAVSKISCSNAVLIFAADDAARAEPIRSAVCCRDQQMLNSLQRSRD